MIFQIPAALREYAGGRSSLEIEHAPAILNDVLTQLWETYPGLRDRIITEQGQVRTHINIFVGDENIRYLGGLAARVAADSIISIIPAVSGGCLEPLSGHAMPASVTNRKNQG
ncbi:MAG TPA: MoaD/ThiS family protein [Acidobacteriaceae bacterium]|nr:MoaD/ThiS family protein [Acidobacteriaceae bacterium]